MSSRTPTTRTGALLPCEVKVFSSRVGCQPDIEDAIAEYLTQHPGYTVKQTSMACNEYNVFVTVTFEMAAMYLPMFIEKDRVNLPMKPVEITCDDPWKGEFIPVGDPPNTRPTPMAVSQRLPNVAEQFGAGYH